MRVSGIAHKARVISLQDAPVNERAHNRMDFCPFDPWASSLDHWLMVAAAIFHLKLGNLLTQLANHYIAFLHFHLHFRFQVSVLFLLFLQYSVELEDCVLVSHIAEL